MKRAIIILVLLWLVASTLILRPRVRDLIRPGVSTLFPDSVPSAVVGSRPAFVKDYEYRSEIEIDHVPAWYEYDLVVTLSPSAGDDVNARGVDSNWEAVSIDAPFHIIFRKPDGTLTDPLRVEFNDYYRRHRLQWNDEGDAVLTHVRLGAADGTSERSFGRRHWNARVVLRSLAGPLMLIAAMAAAMFIPPWIFSRARARRIARMNLCPNCGYDLSGCSEPGCPECGTGRGASGEGGGDKAAADQ